MLSRFLISAGLLFLVAVPLVIFRMIPESTPKKEVTSLFWKDLKKLDLEFDQIPSYLEALDGEVVRVPGFVVPLVDEKRKVKEFVLVPTPMACIHVPAPPPNQIVHVILEEEVKVEDFYRPVWAKGVFQIKEIRMTYGKASYQIKKATISPYRKDS